MLGGLLGGLVPTLHNVNSVVNDVAETLSPGSTSGGTTTGNLIADDNGATADLISGLGEGNLGYAVAHTYANIVGPGGVFDNLAHGGGLGIEGLLGNVLGTADGILGTGDGLLGGLPLLGSSDGLLDGVLGGLPLGGDLLG